jgi:hypothetical protein
MLKHEAKPKLDEEEEAVSDPEEQGRKEINEYDSEDSHEDYRLDKYLDEKRKNHKVRQSQQTYNWINVMCNFMDSIFNIRIPREWILGDLLNRMVVEGALKEHERYNIILWHDGRRMSNFFEFELWKKFIMLRINECLIGGMKSQSMNVISETTPFEESPNHDWMKKRMLISNGMEKFIHKG